LIVMNAASMRCALNHMTAPQLGHAAVIDMARELGCAGVELRNDLAGRDLFDGDAPEAVKIRMQRAGLRLLALAEIKRFNAWSAATEQSAGELMRIAVAAGAEAVSLIPVNDGTGCGNGERQANLRVALRALKPMLEDHGLIGLVEPLGFDVCSLRYKEEAVEAIEALGAAGRFMLIHDTFHHCLADERRLFPEHTGIVHISGVVDPKISVGDMRDPHRVLVDGRDRLGNVEQILALRQAGYDGPISYEAFSPAVHALSDPKRAIAESMAFIDAELSKKAA
jgi:2-keto-myo-inositol isomerase